MNNLSPNICRKKKTHSKALHDQVSPNPQLIPQPLNCLPQTLTVFLELLIILQNSSLVNEPLFLRRNADRGSNVLFKLLYIHLQAKRDQKLSAKVGKGEGQKGDD